MNPEYIRKIEELLGEMRKKQMDPVGKADADIDNDGDVDSSDKYLHNRRKAISKSMKKEGEGKVTKCGACEGSTENHDPECPKAKSEACGDYGKKTKKEEVEQVAEDDSYYAHHAAKKAAGGKSSGPEYDKHMDAEMKKRGYKRTDYMGSGANRYAKEEVEQVAEYSSANHTVYGHKADGTKKVIGRAHGDDADSAVKNFHNSPGNAQMKSVYKGFSAKRDHVEYNNQPVVSEQWGFGEVIETTDEGLNVYFDHGVEFNVPASSLTFLEDKKHMKGATKPEGLLDKESPRSKQFVKDHQKSDKEFEDKEKKGHEDATKAGRVTKQAPARPGEKRVGDTKIVNPVQGAVTQTTGKE